MKNQSITRKGNPCMKHYQGMNHIKKYAKENKIYSAIFQSGAVFARILDDDKITSEEKNILLNKFYTIQRVFDLDRRDF